METITVDGVDEHDFRHAIEDMLRLDQVDEAVARLRALLAPYVGGFLPSRFLDITSASIEFAGWNRLAERLNGYDRENFPISAIGIALADARTLGGPGPSGGKLAPFIKTFYFSDDAYPFTDATRDDLLDGYTREGFGWQGDYQASDATLSIKGIDDLHGALIELEDRLFDAPNPPEDAFRAGAIGACYLAVLIHQALRDQVRTNGLPRPLCVLAACDGVYPFFDAPVAGSDECTPAPLSDLADEEIWPNELESARPAEDDSEPEHIAGEGSLLAAMHLRTKRPVMVLDAESAAESARFTELAESQRMVVADDLALKGIFHGIPAAEYAPVDWPEPDLPELAPAEPAPAPAPEPEPYAQEQVAWEYVPYRPAAVLLAAPTGRSIRARIHPVRPAPTAGRPAYLALLDWVRRLILRR